VAGWSQHVADKRFLPLLWCVALPVLVCQVSEQSL
jgi:hypothetical protein